MLRGAKVVLRAMCVGINITDYLAAHRTTSSASFALGGARTFSIYSSGSNCTANDTIPSVNWYW